MHMKNFIMILTMIAAAAISTSAQSPAPDPDTLKNPVKDIDPEVKQLPADGHYAKEAVRINADELPAAVLSNLKKLEPDAWQKSVVYRHKSNNTYVVEIRASGREKVYRFNKDGKRIEADKPQD
jgi:hypothetical protein